MSALMQGRLGAGTPAARCVSPGPPLLLPVVLGTLLPLVGVACGSLRIGQQPPAAAGEVARRTDEAPQDPVEAAQQAFDRLAAKLEEAGKGSVRTVDELWLRDELNRVLALDPSHKLARFNLAVLEERSGGVDDARDTYEELMEEDPGFHPAAENMARYMVQQGDTERAKRIYRAVATRDRKNVTSRLALARLLGRDGLHKEAVQLCKEALGGKSDSLEAYRILATSYKHLGNIPMAELSISRGMQIASDDVDLGFSLAQILMERGEVTAGVARLRELLVKAPQRLDIRAELGRVAMAHRDFSTAAQQYDAILESDPNNAAAKLGIAVARTRTGELEAAERAYRDLLAQKPNDPDVLWNVAVLYHQYLQRPAEAQKYYQRFVDAAAVRDDNVKEARRRISALREMQQQAQQQQGAGQDQK